MFQDKVKLGPCTLEFGALNIDFTHGGVTLHVEPMMKEIKADQYGEGAADHRITGWIIKAIVPMTQTDYDSIKGVATFLEETESGKLQDRPIGTSMRDNAQELRLHPLETPGGEDDVVFYKAAAITAMEIPYGYEDQRVYNVEFQAYPKDDMDPANAGNFFEIGGIPGDVLIHTVTFTVVEAAAGNAEIEGAEVSVTGHAGSKLTDSDGKAYFYLKDDEYVYAVSKDGFNTELDAFTVDGADLAVNVELGES